LGPVGFELAREKSNALAIEGKPADKKHVDAR
jgi:hypothetical protein